MERKGSDKTATRQLEHDIVIALHPRGNLRKAQYEKTTKLGGGDFGKSGVVQKVSRWITRIN